MYQQMWQIMDGAEGMSLPDPGPNEVTIIYAMQISGVCTRVRIFHSSDIIWDMSALDGNIQWTFPVGLKGPAGYMLTVFADGAVGLRVNVQFENRQISQGQE